MEKLLKGGIGRKSQILGLEEPISLLERLQKHQWNKWLHQFN